MGLYVVGGSRERPKVGLSLELVGEIGLPRPTIWTPDKHPGLQDRISKHESGGSGGNRTQKE